MARYDVKLPLVKLAKRVTFVIGKDRRILSRESGGAALDPQGALTACPL